MRRRNGGHGLSRCYRVEIRFPADFCRRNENATPHDRRYSSLVRSSTRTTQEGDRRFRGRVDLVRRRADAAARGGTPARPCRDAGRLHPGVTRLRAGTAHAADDAGVPHVRDRVRMRIQGCRRLRRPVGGPTAGDASPSPPAGPGLARKRRILHPKRPGSAILGSPKVNIWNVDR